MATLARFAARFAREEDGLETVEYAVMTALIVGAIVAALMAFGGAMVGRFDTTRGVVESV
jgi:Flp pilus assembly pilin Flp